MNILLSSNIPSRFTNSITLRIAIFCPILLWCAGFSILSFFPDSVFRIFYPLLKQAYSFVCHQVDYKTFKANDIHFLVCARCTGIYFGALIASLVFLFYNINSDLSSKFLFIASVPMLLDIIFYSAGIYNYSVAISFSTGVIFGSTSIVYILIVLQKYFFQATKVTDDLK